MENQIKLIKNNDRDDKLDIDWIEDFFEFLKGEDNGGIVSPRGHLPKMSHKKAFSIIYYLQEILSVFPENIEKCSNCNSLFDTNHGGLYWESKGKHYCGNCEYLVPDNYDNCMKG